MNKMLNFFQNNSASITALATMVLAVITLAYMIANWLLVKEQKKERQSKEVPILKALSIARKTKPHNSKFWEQYPDSSPYFYEIQLQNIKGGIAYLESIHLWEKSGDDERSLVLLSDTTEITLFPEQKETFVTYDAPKSNTVPPLRIQVRYKDRFGNRIRYNAKTSLMLAAPTPWLGVKNFIEHKFNFLDNLK